MLRHAVLGTYRKQSRFFMVHRYVPISPTQQYTAKHVSPYRLSDKKYCLISFEIQYY